MPKVLISDLSRVLLFPKDESYYGLLNDLHSKLVLSDFHYDFWKHFVLNQALLSFYQSLEVPVYLFTSEYIQEHPPLAAKLEPVFTQVFSSARLGGKKSEPVTYQALVEKIGLKTEDFIFVDDSVKNIDAAKTAGMKTVLYKSNQETEEAIKMALSS